MTDLIRDQDALLLADFDYTVFGVSLNYFRHTPPQAQGRIHCSLLIIESLQILSRNRGLKHFDF
jgi:hypothetical protein